MDNEDAMRIPRLFGSWTALVLVALVGLTACTYDAAVRQLSPAEQAEFSLYHHRALIMASATPADDVLGRST